MKNRVVVVNLLNSTTLIGKFIESNKKEFRILDPMVMNPSQYSTTAVAFTKYAILNPENDVSVTINARFVVSTYSPAPEMEKYYHKILESFEDSTVDYKMIKPDQDFDLADHLDEINELLDMEEEPTPVTQPEKTTKKSTKQKLDFDDIRKKTRRLKED